MHLVKADNQIIELWNPHVFEVRQHSLYYRAYSTIPDIRLDEC